MSSTAVVLSIICLIASSDVAAQNSQTGNPDWTPSVANPAFEPDRGPVVLVDAAHGNFHTIEGRYATFAKLLGLDGYSVRSGEAEISTESLSAVEILVISNAIPSFTGQAFRFVGPVQPLLLMPDDWEVLLPAEAWEFDVSTATVSAKGLIQGGVLKFGSGRVAVFGEAAMFTAQNSVRDGVTRQMGMSDPSARENAQFVLNVMHWLSGLFKD